MYVPFAFWIVLNQYTKRLEHDVVPSIAEIATEENFGKKMLNVHRANRIYQFAEDIPG
jgi:hypothetical protein